MKSTMYRSLRFPGRWFTMLHLPNIQFTGLYIHRGWCDLYKQRMGGLCGLPPVGKVVPA